VLLSRTGLALLHSSIPSISIKSSWSSSKAMTKWSNLLCLPLTKHAFPYRLNHGNWMAILLTCTLSRLVGIHEHESTLAISPCLICILFHSLNSSKRRDTYLFSFIEILIHSKRASAPLIYICNLTIDIDPESAGSFTRHQAIGHFRIFNLFFPYLDNKENKVVPC